MFYHVRLPQTTLRQHETNLMSTSKIRTVPCPICKEPSEWSPANEYRPFCSRRCKLIDLGQWATDKYCIPGQEPPTPQQLEMDDEE